MKIPNDFQVFDDFLPDPVAYRESALQGEFRSYEFPECTFHGISLGVPGLVPERLAAMFPGAEPLLSFFRKSPAGQSEPHFIHTDVDMGHWSAILYLNPNPPPEDGTVFWRHIESGEIGSAIPHERSEEGKNIAGWEMRGVVKSQFNRLMVFPSHLFHSRAIHENWGDGDNARLTQVTFGKESSR